MNLIQFLIIFLLFLGGSIVGNLVSRWIFFLPHGMLEVVFGIVSVLFLSWPVYKRFGLLPQPPPCPRCNEIEYVLISQEPFRMRWQCKHCGQVILLEAESVIILDEKGVAVRKFELRWPKFWGRWKEVSLPRET
jgi:phage FluMu protein Com